MSIDSIVLVHNRYKEPGGEDAIFAAEAALLRDRGHAVSEFVVSNEHVDGLNALQLTRAVLWNRSMARELRSVLGDTQADVVHFHNTFPLISPAAYYAARDAGAAIVQTLHNYRLVCPGTLLLRDGRRCEACIGSHIPWRAVAHKCYRDSWVESAGAASMVSVHWLAGTWSRVVDAYIVLSEFARDRFVAGNLPSEKLFVKPNFVYPDPGVGPHDGGYALFVGRLAEEKGVALLMAAWDTVGDEMPLKVVGDGPLGALVSRTAQDNRNVEWLGQRSHDEVLALMKEATVLILPSLASENFPVAIVEAFATGLPVIATDAGAVGALVDNDRTGMHFRYGDPEALAQAVRWASTHPESLRVLGRAARAEFEQHYTAGSNYSTLLNIYEQVVDDRRKRVPPIRNAAADSRARPPDAGDTG